MESSSKQQCVHFTNYMWCVGLGRPWLNLDISRFFLIRFWEEKGVVIIEPLVLRADDSLPPELGPAHRPHEEPREEAAQAGDGGGDGEAGHLRHGLARPAPPLRHGGEDSGPVRAVTEITEEGRKEIFLMFGLAGREGGVLELCSTWVKHKGGTDGLTE